MLYEVITPEPPHSMPWPCGPAHVRHRCFTRWVEAQRPDFRLVQHVPNPHPYRAGAGSFADFFVFARRPGDSESA